ncbi:hypothetical protein ILP97_38730 [Amycolatopsis sp. H6(2020)]|nr:hypothetical protein [Amycolatopsis sp. H6(2020)]
MRIRIALTLGALVLAGGALTGGIALASEAQAPAAPSPTQATRPGPTVGTPPVSTRPGLPTAMPAPRETTMPRTGQAPRVPRAVPAGPTGDLHLPAVWETR